MGHKLFVSVPLPCAWIHPESFEIRQDEEDPPPGCPECGKLLSWGHCWFCGVLFLIFGSGGDDIMADAAVTDSGDLMCFHCAVEMDRDEQEGYRTDSWGWQDGSS